MGWWKEVDGFANGTKQTAMTVYFVIDNTLNCDGRGHEITRSRNSSCLSQPKHAQHYSLSYKFSVSLIRASLSPTITKQNGIIRRHGQAWSPAKC